MHNNIVETPDDALREQAINCLSVASCPTVRDATGSSSAQQLISSGSSGSCFEQSESLMTEKEANDALKKKEFLQVWAGVVTEKMFRDESADIQVRLR